MGLLALGDSRAAQPLVDYYWKHKREVTLTESTAGYLEQIYDMDRQVGIDFAFRILQEDELFRKEAAEEFLSKLVTGGDEQIDPEAVELLVSQLQNLALRSKDALVRAKLLLQRKAEWDKWLKEQDAKKAADPAAAAKKSA